MSTLNLKHSSWKVLVVRQTQTEKSWTTDLSHGSCHCSIVLAKLLRRGSIMRQTNLSFFIPDDNLDLFLSSCLPRGFFCFYEIHIPHHRYRACYYWSIIRLIINALGGFSVGHSPYRKKIMHLVLYSFNLYLWKFSFCLFCNFLFLNPIGSILWPVSAL